VILALDTSGDELVVALVEDGRPAAGSAQPGRRHQDRIMSAIAEAAGEGLARVEAVAVVRGPGSHTGLRVGMSTAIGLAFGRRLPIYPLSSLSVAAHRAFDGDGRVLALVAAGRGRVYGQEFTREGASRRPLGPRRLLTIGEIDMGSGDVVAEPALLAQLSGAVTAEVRGGVDALVATVSQVVGEEGAVNYDQLTGDYGDRIQI
jgi:tRNA threonylcarbamoyladenosine biosynthesis protein TsaB